MKIEHEGVSIGLSSLIKLRHLARKFDLKTLSRVATFQSGLQHSAFRGRGVDFAEVRSYQPGDDIRNMDWRVTARTGKPHTKIYHQEKERPVYFLVDYSSHMYFGTRGAFKSVIAAQVTALLAWNAIFAGDRVGAIVMRDKERIELRPQSATRSALRLFNVLARSPIPDNYVQQKSQMFEALKRLRRVAKPGSLIVIVSDFIDLTTKAELALSQLREHNEILSVFVYDAIEKDPPPAGRYIVSDNHDFFALNTNHLETCAKYRERFSKHTEHLKTCMRKRRIPLLEIATDDDVPLSLQRFLSHCETAAQGGVILPSNYYDEEVQ